MVNNSCLLLLLVSKVFWYFQLMMSTVEVGEELMPHRTEVNISSSCEPAQVNEETLEIAPTMPTRKLSRNRGLVLPEQSAQETSLENEDAEVRAAAIRKGFCGASASLCSLVRRCLEIRMI